MKNFNGGSVYVNGRVTPMSFSIDGNFLLRCTYDSNGNGVLDETDELLTYDDSADPLPYENGL